MRIFRVKRSGLFTVLLVNLMLSNLVACAQQACMEDRYDPCPDIRKQLEKFRCDNEIPGVSVGCVLADGTEYAVAVGVSDKESGKSITTEDRILSGSIGKTYVAAVAMQMVEERKLVLDKRISSWLGDEAWFARLPNAERITVRMLMNHSSGIPEHVRLPEFGKAVSKDPDRVWTPEERVAYILDHEPLFEAGKGWSYADTNYIVLGMIIEKIADRAFYDELIDRILKPFNLEDTVPADRRVIPGLIPGYALRPSPFLIPGKTMKEGVFVLNPQAEWTGGGLASTPLDLARWARTVYEGKAFSKTLLEESLQGLPAFTGPGDEYGLGIMIWKSKHGKCLGHGGWFPGYLSVIAYYPEFKCGVGLQMNYDALSNGTQQMREQLDAIVSLLIKRG